MGKSENYVMWGYSNRAGEEAVFTVCNLGSHESGRQEMELVEFLSNTAAISAVT